jgi:hypothetical protein
MTASGHDRLRPGLNHLAFHAGSQHHVDALAAEGPAHAWTLLFPETHPYAGGPEHYAAYLANTDGFQTYPSESGTTFPAAAATFHSLIWPRFSSGRTRSRLCRVPVPVIPRRG